MSQYAVPVLWSPDTRLHDPRHEVWVGCPDRRDRDVRAGRRDPRRAGRAGVPAGRGPARRRAAGPGRGPRPRARSSSSARPPSAGPTGRTTDLVGQDRVVPYLFPTPGDDRRAAGPAGRRRARGRRPVRLRHDDAGRARHLRGRPRRRRLRHRRGRAGLVGRRAAGVRAVPATRPPRHARPASAAPATSTTPPSPPRCCAPAAPAGSAIVDVDAHQGNGTAAIFYERRDVRYGSVHVDPGAGWFPHVVGYAEETGAGDGDGRHPQPPAARGHRRRRLARGRGRARRLGRATATPWSSRSASTRRPTTRRARSQVTADGYRAAGRLLGATGLPTVVVQEGGYHLPTLGGLVAAYLEGHAGASRR